MKSTISTLAFLFVSLIHAQSTASPETNDKFKPGPGAATGKIEECDFVEKLDNNNLQPRKGYCVDNVQLATENMQLGTIIKNQNLIGKSAILVYDGLNLHQSHFDWTNSAAKIKSVLILESNNIVNLLESAEQKTE